VLDLLLLPKNLKENYMRRPLDISSERNFGKPPATTEEINRYRQQMNEMFGDTSMPTVVYKGETIGRRSI